MAESELQPGGALRIAATAANEAEAELFLQRLAQAGIDAQSERVIGSAEFGSSGARYVYVAATDLARARELLKPPDEGNRGSGIEG